MVSIAILKRNEQVYYVIQFYCSEMSQLICEKVQSKAKRTGLLGGKFFRSESNTFTRDFHDSEAKRTGLLKI